MNQGNLMNRAAERFVLAVVMVFVSLFAVRPTLADQAGLELAVDVSADRHPIDPMIYGMAYASPEMAREIELPLNRWGGDGTTRYNWQIDSSNSGEDWFYMAGSDRKPVPSGTPDKWVQNAREWNGKVMLTIPIIDFINSATTYNCSYPVSIFPHQQKTNPYVHPTIDGKRTDAGNGKTPDGKDIVLTTEQILRIHIRNKPQFQADWVRHLVGAFGPGSRGGVPLYELDNEPGGWNNTHRDIHPGPTGHDELVSRSIAYAAAVKTADATALTVGPGDFMYHYQSDGKPGDGKKEHNGLGQGYYYLQQFAQYQKQHGKRLLDYFDEHFYPMAQDGQTEETAFEATRSLYDPEYRENNWVGKFQGPTNLIPSMRKWVAQYYPGTKVSISEWGWSKNDTLIGALSNADVLGIFAREGLDMACRFGAPKSEDAAANAWRLYRNYDGKGSKFGETYVRSLSSDQMSLSVYAALRKSDGALTLAIINKSTGDLSAPVKLAGFHARGKSAKVYRYDANSANNKIAPVDDQSLDATGFTGTFPARSMTLIEIPGLSRR